MIGIGAFFGLQNSVPHLTTNMISSTHANALNEPVPSRDQLLQQVGQALEKSKPTLLKSCPTETKKAPDRFMIDYTFSTEGRQVARGFSENRSNTRHGLGACLSGALPAITILPPGRTVNVEAEFSFP